jgi:3-hydroxyacyl-CoA dehydrogenase
MNAAVSLRVERGVALVTIANPPVNGLTHAVRAGLFQAFKQIAADDTIEGAVLHGAGRCFSAGGDIREFGTAAATADPGLSKDVHQAIERCGKTVVAAIHGYALGGGLETALACHYRVAAPDARLALPEVKLGVVPLSGTQRLPRLIGVEAAIDMILSGRDVRAFEAPRRLIDAMVETDELLACAANFARREPPPLVRDMPFPENNAPLFNAARAAISKGEHPPFGHHLIDAMECGAGVSFDDGLRRARAIYDAVVDSPDSQAARAAFLTSRSSSKAEA